MTDKRIIQLTERQTLESGDYVALDNSTDGSHKYDLKALGDKVAANETALGGHTVGKSVPADAVFTDTTYSDATQSAAGLMSAADKTKLDGVAAGANNYSLPTMSSSTKGGAKVGSGLTIDSEALKLADSGVGTSQIADGAVTVGKLSSEIQNRPHFEFVTEGSGQRLAIVY